MLVATNLVLPEGAEKSALHIALLADGTEQLSVGRGKLAEQISKPAEQMYKPAELMRKLAGLMGKLVNLPPPKKA